MTVHKVGYLIGSLAKGERTRSLYPVHAGPDHR
ncbi:hypothetical protein GGQ64_005442 [Rhizobium azooxidifex]|uniref:Uncharacterized protein n=1 Tax=Mycoplana azooxidifex TaxID=1636188 RepID=A0A7W6DGH5_9HYPH|nr:hypothetical protein [Mycoplana azooxidifex]